MVHDLPGCSITRRSVQERGAYVGRQQTEADLLGTDQFYLARLPFTAKAWHLAK